MRIATLAGKAADVPEPELDALGVGLDGYILRPGMGAYDQARIVFNAMFDRRPALIVRCRGTTDVCLAVKFARRHDLLFSVRGGGHSIAGLSSCDHGMVIDLSLMRSVTVSALERIARVAGGATWADVDRETQRFGLATPGGVVSHTGVAGLTLNGGIGWLRNSHGLSCDNLRRIEVVDADGEVLQVSDAQRAALFWALRGGGGNFGIVTSMEFRLHPVGPLVAASFPMYPLADADEVLERWFAWVQTAPEEASSEFVLWTMPRFDSLPAGARGQAVVIPSAVFAGDAAAGLVHLEPLRAFGTRLGEIHGALPYLDVQRAFDASFPNTGELCCYWKSLFAYELTPEVRNLLVELARHRSSDETMIVVQHMAGAARKPAQAGGAYAARDAPFLINLMGAWRERAESARHIAWVRDAWRRLAKLATSTVYLNYLGEEGSRSRELVRGAFGANFDRLVDIKTKYDPANVFRMNQNIPPR